MIYFLTILLACYFFILSYFYVFQRQLIYFPRPMLLMSSLYDSSVAQRVTLTTEDNLSLQAIYQPARDDKPTLIYFFGNGGILGQLSPTLASLVRAGYGMLQVDAAYEQLKAFTRGQPIDVTLLASFISQLTLPKEAKEQLQQLTPQDYIGYAQALTLEKK